MIKTLKRIFAWDCRRILCCFGRHVWEREPTLKDHIRFNGQHQGLIAISGIQTARRKCKLCATPHGSVYCRQGVVGFGSEISPFSTGPWREIDSQEEELIKVKPVIT